MGMDLEPINPSSDAPKRPMDEKYSPGEPVWGRYNWSGWSWLRQHLDKWGVNTYEFSGMNDGNVISEPTCKAVADALEGHIDELEAEFASSYEGEMKEAQEFIDKSKLSGEQAKIFLPSSPSKKREWVEEQIKLWRTCGGYRQF